MYIEIADDIIQILHNKKHTHYKSALWLLREIALCMKHEKHYISIPALRKDFKLKSIIQNALPDIYGLLIQADESYAKSLKEQLSWYMLVTEKIPPSSTPNTVIYYNPFYDNEFEVYEETHLICENLYDCELYRLIGSAYYKKTGFLGLILNFLPRNGGGATTATVVRDELKRKAHLCLIITDSDRRYRQTINPDPVKNPSEFGDTFNKVEKEIQKNDSKFIYHHVLRRTREAENLIPHRILSNYFSKKHTNLKTLIIKKGNDTSFFDFKEGLRYTDLNTEKEYKYWAPILKELNIDVSKRKQYKENARKYKEKYYKLVEGEPPIIPGLGKTILSTILEDSKQAKKLEILKYCDLTEDQRYDWEEIGQHVFSWAIARRYS